MCFERRRQEERQSLRGVQGRMLRAVEERSGEWRQGGWVDFHVEELLKVKVVELFSANEFWHFFLLSLVPIGLYIASNSLYWPRQYCSDREGVVSVHSGSYNKTP